MAATDTSSTPNPAANPDEATLRRRLEAQPDDVGVLVDLAILLAHAERFAEARELMGRALALRADDVGLYLSAGGMAANDGDIDAAHQHYRTALSLRDDAVPAYVGLGQIARLRGQPSAAEEHFATALKLAPDDTDAALGMAALLLEQGRVEQAVERFVRVLQAHPRHASTLAGYGQALMQRGTPDEAVRPLKRALELDPGLQLARLLLAHVELYRGNVPQAEKAYREVLRAQPSNGDALAGLGDALRAQDRFDEAFLAYDAARRTNPDAEMLTTMRDTCLGAMGRGQEAIEDLHAFVQTHPRSVAPRLLLADLYHGTGRADLAQTLWQQAADADPADGLAWAELALLHERAGALEVAASAAARSGTDQRVVARLMRARMALRGADAGAAQRELLALKPEKLAPEQKRDRYRLLGLAHDRAERWAEAALAFREAHRVQADSLPGLVPAAALQPVIEPLLAEQPLLHPRVAPPVLLLGLPGSGVEHVAALLADQASLAVREERFGGQTDFFADATDSALLVPLPQSRLGVLARRYARAQDRVARRDATGVVDWIPVFDARLLPAIKLALPGARAVIVDAAPRLAYLRWLAFGWQRRLRIADSKAAAAWFNLAQQQLDLAAQHLPVLRVDGDALLADPATDGAELARFLDIEQLAAGPISAGRQRVGQGLVAPFTPGHEQCYEGVLAEAFARLP